MNAPVRTPELAESARAVAERARAFHAAGHTRSEASRRARLLALRAAIQKFEPQIYDALKRDLGKPKMEAYPAEIGITIGEINHLLHGLRGWMKPRRVATPLVAMPGRSALVPEPLGTALIISPWNYPFQLAVHPIAGAIAAGCNVVLKPSELSPATSAVIAAMMKDAFPADDGFIQVLQGGPEVSTALLEEKWDLVFFTGSTHVGRIVAQAAARHLTPTVLVLGGKSPTFIDADADLEVTARRIAWGKFYNAGQTCIAPDYVLAHASIHDAFVAAMKRAVTELFGADPQASPDYGRIVSERHWKRLDALKAGGTVALGGQGDLATKYLAPTLLTAVDAQSPLMQEEIFGPLLPVLKVDDMDEGIRFVNARPKPLALYAFTKSSATAEKILSRCSSGGAIVNDVLLHISVAGLPFGGVGDSGMGGYHGRHSFDVFSHLKGVVKKPFWMDLKLRYPPYKESNLGLFKKLME